MDTSTVTVPDVWLTTEPPCQSTHTPPIPDCTITVIARKHVTCAGMQFNICRTSYEYNQTAMTGGGPCDKCGRPCDQCWRIVPI